MALQIDAVSYAYPHSGRVALSEVSCTFGSGTTAIVGPNGAGKSTLVKLLTGLLAPTSGRITAQLPGGACVAGNAVPKAVLFQEPSHLYLSIRQNVTMRFERTPGEDERIHEALEMAGLGKVVRDLPDGIDTLVGAGFGGQIDLSGGQWQRLALARLVYQDAPVMILDEPVASLDPEGERAVFQLFAERAHDKVIIFTTHRYDSIPPETTIVVLTDGHITETGTHAELLRRQRAYWSLYSAAKLAPGQVAKRSGPPRVEAAGALAAPALAASVAERSPAPAATPERSPAVAPAASTTAPAPRKGRLGRPLVLALGLAVASLAVPAAGLAGLRSPGSEASPPPSSVQAALSPSTAQPVASVPATPDPLQLDSPTTTGWQAWPDDPSSGAWAAADGYHLVVRQPNQFVAVDAPLSSSSTAGDVLVRASFRKLAGPAGSGFGVIVRDQGTTPRDSGAQTGWFDLLEVNDAGAVGIWQREGSAWRDVLPWTRTTAVQQGQGALNQLEVQASGPQLSLRVNGVTVATWDHAMPVAGLVGVFVGGEVGTDVRLEHFRVRSPS